MNKMKHKLFQVVLVVFFSTTALIASEALLDGFVRPPPSARSQVWWHWMNGNVTKEGITADLEAMARAGVGGAYIFDVPTGIPEGKVRFASDAWFDMLAHANAEAKRLGLEISIANCPGWSSSGGPWVKPEDSMKVVVCTERIVRGGEKIAGGPPSPAAEVTHGFYRDIATLAFPRPAAEAIDPKDYGMITTFKPGDAAAVFRFKKPFPLTGLSLDIDVSGGYRDGVVKVDVSEDGETFRTAVDRMTIYPFRFGRRDDKLFVPVSEKGKPINVRAFKIVIDLAVETAIPGKVWEGAKSVRPPGVKGLKSPGQRVRAIRPEARARIPEFKAKTFAMRAKIHGHPYAAPQGLAVDSARIVDLTGKETGWTAPAGSDWVVVRFGYASNGEGPHPATAGGKGLEVDKLSKAALGRFFAGYVDKVLARCGPVSSEGGLCGVLVDSYEVNGQNWTDGFEKIFKERRGYDLVSRLPILTGRVVGSPEVTERFLSDFRRTISELFAENYAGEFHRLARARGLRFSLEGYGSQPCDDLKYARHCDIPMGEFWAGNVSGVTANSRIGATLNCRFPGFIAHVWGQRVVGAEAFTSTKERWDRAPVYYKAQGDRAYCQGVNRLVYHTWAHQPWTNPANYPGMTMGFIGSNFSRTQTWWEDGAPGLLAYQARCQWMLQEGVTAADVLVFAGDGTSGFGLDLTRWHDHDLVGENAFGLGRQWDVCNGEAIRAVRAEGGQIVAPSGARYNAVAVLPNISVDPESQTALDRLAAQGAAVVPAADVHKALVARGIGPDVVCLTKECSKDFRWIHRKTGGPRSRAAEAAADTEWYFVALPNEQAVSFELSFRMSGKVPEIWNPETGRVSKPSAWCEKGGRTKVRLDFDPFGSAFVVFRKKETNGTDGTNGTYGTVSAVSAVVDVPVTGPWQISFPIGWHFGTDDAKTVEWPELKDWSADADPDIKYFSGTATYTIRVPSVSAVASVSSPRRLILDLGDVKHIATVTVNGKTFPALWKPPYSVDVTDALGGPRCCAAETVTDAQERVPPVLDIEIRVTNLWPNRLIGDDALPSDAAYNMPTKRWKGGGLKSIPSRVFEGKPSPTGRHTFTTWRHWKKDDKPLPSGLIGPVRLIVNKEMTP